MHKVLTPYGRRKEDVLNKAQARKVVNLVIFEASKLNRNGEEFVNRLIEEFPALKRLDQQERVVKKANEIEARGRAMHEITSKLLERIN